MEDVTIESLIAQGRVVTTPDLINPLSDYMVVGVYQTGTSKIKGIGTSYKNYVISIAELLGGGSAYTASNGIVLVGNDFQLASGANSKAWAPDGNTFGAEKYIGTNDNFALPFRVFSKEVARFTNDPSGATRMYINANTNLHGSNAGIQYSSDGSSPNRSQIRFNLYGNNTGAPGVTGFKSRGGGIGTLASVLAGDNLFRLTTIGVSGNNSSINLASLIDVRVASVLPGYVATDFVVALNSLAGVMTERLYVTSEGDVGIGTSTPTARIQGVGVDATAGNFVMKLENIATTSLFAVRNDGNVGIGTLTPGYKLDVQGIVNFEVTPLIFHRYQTADQSWVMEIGNLNYLRINRGAALISELGASGTAILANTVSTSSVSISTTNIIYRENLLHYFVRTDGNAYGWWDATNGKFKIGSPGGITSAPTSIMHVKGAGYEQLRLENSFTPANSADANGLVGDVAWDDSYVYTKVSTGWKRAGLTAF